RWALTCMWRTDGQPIWNDPMLLAAPEENYEHDIEHAQLFATTLAKRLGLNPEYVATAYEDAMYYMWKERRLAVNADVMNSDLVDEEERIRLARVFERGLGAPVGCMLPLMHQWWNAKPRWMSGTWPVRSEQLFL
ncbi:MAG TPA: IMP dehydrogenase, partial [Planctomycetaceae bacterium]|nr:IMP dehydrogenase [Planctomycetaceae bacterium]